MFCVIEVPGRFAFLSWGEVVGAIEQFSSENSTNQEHIAEKDAFAPLGLNWTSAKFCDAQKSTQWAIAFSEGLYHVLMPRPECQFP